MLEKLVHFGGELPGNQHFIEITLPAGISYEVVNPDLLAGWSDISGIAALEFGPKGYAEKRSAILVVPPVVARMERNFIFYTGHEDFARIEVGLETPVWWDARLFAR